MRTNGSAQPGNFHAGVLFHGGSSVVELVVVLSILYAIESKFLKVGECDDSSRLSILLCRVTKKYS